MTYRGIRHASPDVMARIDHGEEVDPSEVYFRTAVFFETAAPQHDRLNHVVAVGIGHRRADGPIYSVFEVLYKAVNEFDTPARRAQTRLPCVAMLAVARATAVLCALIGHIFDACSGADSFTASESRSPRPVHPCPMEKPKPFSMIREFHLADWFTLANAACGVGALFSVMTFLQTGDIRHMVFACWLIPAAFVFDVLDGRVARWRQQSSELGRELDSLSDVISFGVAPAAIAYGCGMQGLYDRAVLVFFVACGGSRLARYNITAEKFSEGGTKVKYFEGTPIPTSLLLVVVLAVAAVQGSIGDRLWFGAVDVAGFRFHPLVLIFAISGSLMISRFRIPKL